MSGSGQIKVVGTSNNKIQNFKRATATLTDGSIVALVFDPNQAGVSGDGGDDTGVGKFYLYHSTDGGSTFTLKTTITPTLPTSTSVPTIGSFFKFKQTDDLAFVYRASGGGAYYYKLTYSAGPTWTAGSSETILANMTVTDALNAPVVKSLDADIAYIGGTGEAPVVIMAYCGNTLNENITRFYTRRLSDNTWVLAHSMTQAAFALPSGVADVSIATTPTVDTNPLKHVCYTTTYKVSTGGALILGGGIFTINFSTGVFGSTAVGQTQLDAGDANYNKAWVFADDVAHALGGGWHIIQNQGNQVAYIFGTAGGGWLSMYTKQIAGNNMLPSRGSPGNGTTGRNHSSEATAIFGKDGGAFVYHSSDGVTWMVTVRVLNGVAFWEQGFQPTGGWLLGDFLMGGGHRTFGNNIGFLQQTSRQTNATHTTWGLWYVGLYDNEQPGSPIYPTNTSKPEVSALTTNMGGSTPAFASKLRVQVASDSAFTTSVSDFIQDNSKFTAASAARLYLTLTTAIPTGNWFIRFGLVDTFGRTGYWSAAYAFNISHPPVAVPQISPGADQYILYSAAGTNFSWVFTDTYPQDVQTAYQVIIEKDSDGTTVYDTGIVAGTTTTATIVIPTANKDQRLRWKVRLRDVDLTWGAYSNPQYFYVGDAPGVVSVNPTSGAVLATPVQTFSYTPTFAGARTQQSRRLSIIQGGIEIYSSGWINDTATSFIFNGSSIFTNLNSYTVQFQVKDTANLTTTLQIPVTTSWTLPNSPTFSVSITNFGTAGYNRITWTNSAIDANFTSWRVYRRVAGTTDWTLIDEEFLNLANYTFDDYLAGSNVTQEYAITQVTNFVGAILESLKSSVVSVTPVSNNYWLIHPTNSAKNILLAQVKDDQFTDEYETETFTIIGKGRHTDIGDYLGKTGTLAAQLRDTLSGTARAKRLTLESLKAEKTYVYLRTPFGDIWAVSTGNLAYGRLAGVGVAEFCDVSIPYEQVAL